jgi:hypothetical protein
MGRPSFIKWTTHNLFLCRRSFKIRKKIIQSTDDPSANLKNNLKLDPITRMWMERSDFACLNSGGIEVPNAEGAGHNLKQTLILSNVIHVQNCVPVIIFKLKNTIDKPLN